MFLQTGRSILQILCWFPNLAAVTEMSYERLLCAMYPVLHNHRLADESNSWVFGSELSCCRKIVRIQRPSVCTSSTNLQHSNLGDLSIKLQIEMRHGFCLITFSAGCLVKFMLSDRGYTDFSTTTSILTPCIIFNNC